MDGFCKFLSFRLLRLLQLKRALKIVHDAFWTPFTFNKCPRGLLRSSDLERHQAHSAHKCLSRISTWPALSTPQALLTPTVSTPCLFLVVILFLALYTHIYTHTCVHIGTEPSPSTGSAGSAKSVALSVHGRAIGRWEGRGRGGGMCCGNL